MGSLQEPPGILAHFDKLCLDCFIKKIRELFSKIFIFC